MSEIAFPLLFKIEMNDGSSQLVELTEEQANSLGINLATNPIEKVNKHPLDNKKITEIENGRQLQDASLNIVYRIVKPEDLNLKQEQPVVTTQLPKGRPKKRGIKMQISEIKQKLPNAPVKCIKNIRTRSGRITRPPKHIEKDFKKIDLTDTNVEGDIVTKEFEPLRTNEKPNEKYDGETPLLQLQTHRKRRIISGQYRCPTCGKAYLGQLRLLKHFQKNPNHGNIGENQKQHNSTWKFLIDTALKSSIGLKAKTFCDELSILLQNARILAKYLFKLSSDESAFNVDDFLGNCLGILPGKYTLNENDLCKDVTLFSYLDMNYFDETYLNNHHHQMQEFNKTDKNEIKFENFVEETNKNSNLLETNTNMIIKENSIKENFINKSETVAVVDFLQFDDPSNGKLGGDLKGTLEVSTAATVVVVKKEGSNRRTNGGDKIKKNDYDLDNQLLNVDALILQEVEDSSQNIILDTSTNSDDIMNVDQFVNERFKKLTEPEIDLSNNSLNLDLPALDLFQFHAT